MDRSHILAGAVGLLVGAGATYLALHRALDRKYMFYAEKEISAMRKWVNVRTEEVDDIISEAQERLSEKNEVSEKDISEAAKIINYSKYAQVSDIQQTPEEKDEVQNSIKKNIWADREAVHFLDDTYDLDIEYEKRDQGLPYIVEQEFFLENENDLSQVSLTYFEPDAVLVDEQDRPFSDPSLVGTANLRFGCGSKDVNIVYVHNPNIDVLFEIARSEMSYVEVMGL